MMQRVYGVIDDEVFHRMGEVVDESKVSRAQWIGEAIIEKLKRGKGQTDFDVMKLRDELTKLRDDNKRLNDELVHHQELLTSSHDENNDETMKLRDELMMKSDELDRLKRDHDKNLSEATQRWDELKGFRREIDKLKKELEEAGSSNQRLKDELLKRQAETDLLAKVREELAAIKSDRDRLQEAMRVRDDDVAWLRGHVAQLTQQMALPPSQEEAKKKGWWRFWR
jgi:predicted nuclease with TOPRIM domain